MRMMRRTRRRRRKKKSEKGKKEKEIVDHMQLIPCREQDAPPLWCCRFVRGKTMTLEMAPVLCSALL